MTAYRAFGYPADYILFWLVFLSLVAHTWCFFRFFPWTQRKRLGLVIGNSLVLLCLLGVTFLVGESYERFVAVRTDGFGVSLPARRWFVLNTKLNSYDCRDHEWTSPKPPGVRRIAFLGDSFTYGWGVEDVADRFTDRLQEELGQKSVPMEVMNIAKPGWGTGDHVQRLPDIMKQFAPDEVVLCYVLNDIEDLVPRSDAFDPTRPPEPQWFNPDTSCFLDFLWRRLWLPRMPSVSGYQEWLAGGYADARVWSLQRERMLKLRDLCAERGAIFRVALLPYLREGGERFNEDKLRGQVADAMRSGGVEVLDLKAAIVNADAAALTVNSGDAHPNARAHELFAKVIWKAWYAPN